MRHYLSSLFPVALVIQASAALADSSSKLRIDGFFTSTASWIDTRGASYAGSTNEADFTQSRVGLNFFGEIDEKTEIFTQMIASGENSYHFSADWLFISREVTPGLKVRVGEQVLPAWLTSEFKDVGITYPWIHPPREVYNLNPFKSFSGLSVEADGAAVFSGLSLRLYGGTIDEPIVSYMADGSSILNHGEGKKLVGVAMSVEQGPVTMRASYLQTELELHIYGTTIYRKGSFTSLGLRCDDGDYSIFAEYAKTNGKKDQGRIDELTSAYAKAGASGKSAAATELALAKANILGQSAWYVNLGKRIGSYLPFVQYASLTQPDQPVGQSDQTSLSTGVQKMLSDKLDMKIQWTQITPQDGKNGLVVVESGRSQDTGQVNLYAVSFDAVF